MIHHLSSPDKKEGSVDAGVSDHTASVQLYKIIEEIVDTAFLLN